MPVFPLWVDRSKWNKKIKLGTVQINTCTLANCQKINLFLSFPNCWDNSVKYFTLHMIPLKEIQNHCGCIKKSQIKTLQQRLAIPSNNFPGVLPSIHTHTMMTVVNILFHSYIDVQNVLLILSPIKNHWGAITRKPGFFLPANVYKNTVIHLCDR